MTKERLDKALVSRGLVSSRTRAQRLIEEGHVEANGVAVRDANARIGDETVLRVTGDNIPWVSRAALKLIHALETWDVDVRGKECLDVGSSTGGFTEVLLDRGAKHVTALDVGTNQLAEKIRKDPRVTSIEGVHVADYRNPVSGRVPEIIVIDISFISLEKVFPLVGELLAPHGDIIALIKPQFEVGKGGTDGGIVRDRKLRDEAKERITACSRSLGFEIRGPIESPISGGDGNIEYLILLSR